MLDASKANPAQHGELVWPGRARWQNAPAHHFEQRLAICLGGRREEVPLAAVLANDAGLANGEVAWVSLVPARFDLMAGQLQLAQIADPAVATAIMAHPVLPTLFAEILADYGLQLHSACAGHLLVSGEGLSGATTTPLSALAGADVLALLPRNPRQQGIHWRGLFNDLQMSLHHELAGPGESQDLACNALWPQGAGAWSADDFTTVQLTDFYSDDPVQQCFARAAGVRSIASWSTLTRAGFRNALAVAPMCRGQSPQRYWEALCLEVLLPLQSAGVALTVLAESKGGWRLRRRWWPGQTCSLLSDWHRASSKYSD
jgi:hypothetical protein